jgi:hypothetical protein
MLASRIRLRVRPFCRLGCFVLLLAGGVGSTWAQGEDSLGRPPVVMPVYQLLRPGYDAPGIRLGSFVLTPSVAEMLAGNDNIFASDSRQASDLIFTSGEDFKLGSQWSKNSAAVHLFHEHEIYADHPTENANIYGLEGSFRLDISDNASLDLSTGIVQQPQKRNSPEADRLALSRPLYNTIPFSLGYNQDLGNWHNRVDLGLVQTAYISNAEASRNNTEWRYRDRLSYGLSGDTWPFLLIAYSRRYWNERSSLRDYDTLSGMVGISAQLPGKIDLDLGAGVQRQHFAFSLFDDLVTPTFSGHLTWNILPLTTIIASADQTTGGLETFCDGASLNSACLAVVTPTTATGINDLNGLYNTYKLEAANRFCAASPGNPICAGPLPPNYAAFKSQDPDLASLFVSSVCEELPTIPVCTTQFLRGTLEVTSAQIAIQHEFWHDILGEAQFRFEQDRFEPVDLVDRTWSINLGTRFLLNRNMELDISYLLNIRTANKDLLIYNSGPYQSNLVSLQLKAAL